MTNIFKYLFILLFINSNFVYANNKYSKFMIDNSQKYVEYAFLANRVYDENVSKIGEIKRIFGKPWELYWYRSEKNGFQGAVYRQYGKYVVAIGGTTAAPSGINKLDKYREGVRDIVSDLRLLSNLIPSSQAKSALKFIDDIKKDNIKIDAIAGHSLGGGLAAYAGLYNDIKTFTFNPSPIPFTKNSLEPFLMNYAITLPHGRLKWGRKFAIEYTHSDKITNIMSKDDPLTHWLDSPLIKWDNEEFNPTNPITKLNRVKTIMLIPIQMKLNYIMAGKNIELPIYTGHSIANMLDAMKQAKEYDDYIRYKIKWKNLISKVNKLKDLYRIDLASSFYKNNKLNINFPYEKAYRYYAINALRVIYNKHAYILNIIKKTNLSLYSSNDEFIRGLSLENEVKTDDFSKETENISYREFMKVASATYKKLFGKAFFVFRNIESKKKSIYKLYDDHFRKYAKDDVKTLYKNIFLLHFIGGIPKHYLQNDYERITNSFMVRFIYKFHLNVVKYRNLKNKGGK